MNEPYRIPGGSRDEHTSPTMIGCPACAGSLAIEQDHAAHPHLVCNVGHRFSLESLLEAKEEELERALWSAVVLHAHIEMVGTLMRERPGAALPVPLVGEINRRGRMSLQGRGSRPPV